MDEDLPYVEFDEALSSKLPPWRATLIERAQELFYSEGFSPGVDPRFWTHVGREHKGVVVWLSQYLTEAGAKALTQSLSRETQSHIIEDIDDLWVAGIHEGYDGDGLVLSPDNYRRIRFIFEVRQ